MKTKTFFRTFGFATNSWKIEITDRKSLSYKKNANYLGFNSTRSLNKATTAKLYLIKK